MVELVFEPLHLCTGLYSLLTENDCVGKNKGVYLQLPLFLIKRSTGILAQDKV
jgi:hypothetical protein